jgi:hypothetical protein
LTTPNPITVNVTPLDYTEFATIIDVQGGNGICVCQSGGVHTVNANAASCGSVPAISVGYNAGNCLVVACSDIRTAVSALSIYTITGNSSNTGFTVNHGKNNQFVSVQVVRNSSPYPTVYTAVNRPNANCVCVTFDTAPTTGLEYKILITN